MLTDDSKRGPAVWRSGPLGGSVVGSRNWRDREPPVVHLPPHTEGDAITTFRALHAPGQLLLLANAWDAGSARLIQARGAPAIATTSAEEKGAAIEAHAQIAAFQDAYLVLIALFVVAIPATWWIVRKVPGS
jgi:hypothetical protein